MSEIPKDNTPITPKSVGSSAFTSNANNAASTNSSEAGKQIKQGSGQKTDRDVRAASRAGNQGAVTYGKVQVQGQPSSEIDPNALLNPQLFTEQDFSSFQNALLSQDFSKPLEDEGDPYSYLNDVGPSAHEVGGDPKLFATLQSRDVWAATV